MWATDFSGPDSVQRGSARALATPNSNIHRDILISEIGG